MMKPGSRPPIHKKRYRIKNRHVSTAHIRRSILYSRLCLRRHLQSNWSHFHTHAPEQRALPPGRRNDRCGFPNTQKRRVNGKTSPTLSSAFSTAIICQTRLGCQRKKHRETIENTPHAVRLNQTLSISLNCPGVAFSWSLPPSMTLQKRAMKLPMKA